VRRLVVQGIRDAAGDLFIPDVVRVGPNFADDVRVRSLDALARKEIDKATPLPPQGGGGAGGGAADGTNAPRGSPLDRARLAVLNACQIVCTTLSCAGYAMFSQLQRGFDTVLIDEAAQSVEIASLIPLRTGCQRLILVGDPQQLPATVFSSHAVAAGYERSLFERLQGAGHRTHLLRTQYRMHPDISRFPARHFYSGRLIDASTVVTERARPYHAYRLFAPYSFVDVADGEAELTSGASWANTSEARLVVLIVRHLLAEHAHIAGPGCEHIGVVSPYNGQVKRIRALLRDELGAEAVARLDVHSVDGFQGREKEVILLSCVRAGRGGGRGIGFLKDARRLNVALTRAKSLLIVLGSARTLAVDTTWRALIEDARARGCLLKATAPLDRWFKHASAQPAASAGEAGAAAEAQSQGVGAADGVTMARTAATASAKRAVAAAGDAGAVEPAAPAAKRKRAATRAP
ncbi:hypothetical protein KFE25_014318, partial [Diacronema lutheri]